MVAALVLAAGGWARAEGPDTTGAAQRSPFGAFWRSAALPGWGQVYNGRPLRGGIYGGLIAGCVGMAVVNWESALGVEESAGSRDQGSLFWKRRAWTHGRNNWLILGGFIYILCIVDAYVDAHLQTFDVSPVALRAEATPAGGLQIALAFPWPESRRQGRRR